MPIDDGVRRLFCPTTVIFESEKRKKSSDILPLLGVFSTG